MNLQQTCDPDRLDAFVRGELSEHQESELTAHLDRCAVCGGELERRVAAADQWRESAVRVTDAFTSARVRPDTSAANVPEAARAMAPSVAHCLRWRCVVMAVPSGVGDERR